MSEPRLSCLATREIAGLRGLPRSELHDRWLGLFGKAPPKRLTRDLLVRGIAYEMQAHDLGGLTIKEKKDLAAIAAGRTRKVDAVPHNGTRLYRSWQGVTHEVLVSESGYCWKGETYTSLSQVARAITGTRWSGPRFFGVRS